MRRRGLWLATLFAVGALGAASCGGSVEPSSPDAGAVTAKPPTQAASAGSSQQAGDVQPSRPGEIVDPPRWLRIPSIDVNAPVIDLGLNSDRTLEVPKDFSDTGWWSGGAAPGEPGPAVIVGHVDSYSGPAVFYKLGDLNPGDEIDVGDDHGDTVRFVVDRLEERPKDAFPTDEVYGDTSAPELRLITCSGQFDQSTGHYLDNTIVFASLSSS
jgi:sortase (surface protein transpeptidase)